MIEIADTISFGDLFTGASVLVSAFGIAFSLIYDSRKEQQIARATVLKTTLQSLSLAFEEGLALGEKIKWQQVGVGEYTDKEIVDFGFVLSNKIRALQPSYSVWATEKENSSLEELKEYINKWVHGYAKYLESKENIPSFEEFLETIEEKLQTISGFIRKTLE